MYPSIIYHIFPDRFFRIGNKNENLSDWDSGKPKHDNYFGGNLKGIISKIDYFSSFGIETLYLNPIFEASSNHRYDTKNYYKIDPLLGSMQDFNFLLSSLHKKGISLFLDGVFNHCGTQFFAFEDVLKKQDKSFYKNWFIIRKFPLKIGKGYYKSWKNHFKLVEFNFKNTILKNYLLKVAEFWVSKGIDGWRLDAPERIPFSFWKDFSRKMKSINRNFLIIGEIWEKADKYLSVFDGVTNYQFRNNVINFITQKITSNEFLNIFESYYYSYPFEKLLASWNVISSHDTKRIYTVLNGDLIKIKQAISLQFFLPGSPIIYYGDEIGMTGGNDPDCRKPFNWNLPSWNKEIFYHYKIMITLWKKYSALRFGKYKKIFSNSNTIAFLRNYKNDFLLCIITLKKFSEIKLNFSNLIPIFSTSDFAYQNGVLKIKQGIYLFSL